MEDLHWNEDDLNISGRPLMLEDFVSLDRNVSQAYKYLLECPEDVRDFLEPVINAACDMACNMAYDLGIDPNEVNPDKYTRSIYKPNK